jgi:TolA-binding protein
MLILVNILIIIFILLIIYQIFLAHFNNVIEGLDNNLEYKNYDSTNSSSNSSTDLSQQNSDNIQYLKQQLDSLNNLNQEVQDISGNVATLTTQVNGISQAQSDYAKNTLPDEPPVITGGTEDET